MRPALRNGLVQQTVQIVASHDLTLFVSLVAPEEMDAVMNKLARRLDEWRVWQPAEYGGFGAAMQDPPLIHPAGSTEPASWNKRSWPTMSSLRDVDASCEAEVTSFFNQLQEEES